MTIYLVCDCGKKLKARSDCAGRRVMCPRCRRMWRLPGEDGAPLEVEPLCLDPAEESELAEHDAEPSVAHSARSAWIAGAVALALFVVILCFLYDWYTALAASPAQQGCPAEKSNRDSTAMPVSFPGRKPGEFPAEASAGDPREKQDESAPPRPVEPAERQSAPTPAPPPVFKTQPPEPPPARAEIESVEPAEPLAGGSVVIKLRDAPAGVAEPKYEYRLSPKEPWQPLIGQRLKLTDLKPGMLPLELRAVDPKGRDTPIAQRNLVVKPAPINLSRLKEGDVRWQEVVVTRSSTYRLLGNDVTQNAQYGFLSKLTVDRLQADGSLLVTQRIEVARLERADALLQNLLGDSLEKTRGVVFKITLSPTQEVLKFEGPPQPPQVFGGDAILGGAFLVWSFLDPDAWKELAQHTFFVPDRVLKKDDKWTRPLTHAWGPLGNWTGEVRFVAAGKQPLGQRINYTMDLRYQAPAAGAAASGLPFKVGKADFKPQTAAGALFFDVDKSRVTAAEELFRVRGQMALSLLGTDTVLEIDETQGFQLRVHDKQPARR
jgi:hypothetical protein